jgi:hypothetical protein
MSSHLFIYNSLYARGNARALTYNVISRDHRGHWFM